jgi:F-type H+-transporting ATPase subunit delta
MKGTKSSIRYAKALLELSIEQGKVDLVSNDITFFCNSCKDSHDLMVFLKSPVINSDKKILILNELFSHFDTLTKSFFRLITKNRREAILFLIAESFLNLVREFKGIIPVTLISAIKLEKPTKDKILSKVKTTGKIELSEIIDPNLIGGFIVRIGDVQVDASVDSQLKRLKLDLINNN